VELFAKERALTSDLRGKMGIEEFVMDRQRLGTTNKPMLSLELTSSEIDVSAGYCFAATKVTPFPSQSLPPHTYHLFFRARAQGLPARQNKDSRVSQ
jgi:hypothetical protein